MANALALDTLAYAKKLKAAGFTEEQAEVQAEALAEVIDERLTTKHDLAELQNHLEIRIHEVETRIRELEMRLTIRLGAMQAAAIVIIVALIKLL